MRWKNQACRWKGDPDMNTLGHICKGREKDWGQGVKKSINKKKTEDISSAYIIITFSILMSHMKLSSAFLILDAYVCQKQNIKCFCPSFSFGQGCYLNGWRRLSKILGICTASFKYVLKTLGFTLNYCCGKSRFTKVL